MIVYGKKKLSGGSTDDEGNFHGRGGEEKFLQRIVRAGDPYRAAESSGGADRSHGRADAGKADSGRGFRGFPGKPDRLYHEYVCWSSGGRRRRPNRAILGKGRPGHGEKSVYILSAFMKLSREEALAINWHMGEYDLRVKGGSYSVAEVYYRYPVAFLLHIADLMATYLDEKIESE